MPYINDEERPYLDVAIKVMVLAIQNNRYSLNNPNDLSNFLGRINYCFSKVLAQLMGQVVSYKKIAMITGVLQNIQQEFYRRVASVYEDTKIDLYGDLEEYKNISIF
jgi:hypothetical protein